MGRHCAVLNYRSGYKLTKEQRLKKLLDATKFTIVRSAVAYADNPQRRPSAQEAAWSYTMAWSSQEEEHGKRQTPWSGWRVVGGCGSRDQRPRR